MSRIKTNRLFNVICEKLFPDWGHSGWVLTNSMAEWRRLAEEEDLTDEPGEYNGLCDWNERVILVNTDLRGLWLLATIVHEICHAITYDKKISGRFIGKKTYKKYEKFLQTIHGEAWKKAMIHAHTMAWKASWQNLAIMIYNDWDMDH